VGVDFGWPRGSLLPQGTLYWSFQHISWSSVSSSCTNIGRLAKQQTMDILREDVDMCEYLVIWCKKTTAHEIIDCSVYTHRGDSHKAPN
jgi:hypothetical protein